MAVALGFQLPSAVAQTPPAPTTKFTANSGNLWITDANWSLGDTPTTNDNARINDGQTVVHDIDVLIDGAEMVFGTLTLGTNSTFQFDGGNNLGLPNGSHVYFSNGSHLEYTAGGNNRDQYFHIMPDSATLSGCPRMRGTVDGLGPAI